MKSEFGEILAIMLLVVVGVLILSASRSSDSPRAHRVVESYTAQFDG